PPVLQGIFPFLVDRGVAIGAVSGRSSGWCRTCRSTATEAVTMATNSFGSVVRVLVGLLPLVVAARVDAFSGGITTLSFNQSTGCNACHSGGITPTAQLSGPTLHTTM